MSSKSQDAPAYVHGRRLAPALRRVGAHPASGSRWILRGKKLSDGSVIRLRATRTPGGLRVRDEDMDEFLEAITADRLGNANGSDAPADPTPTPAARARRLANVDRELQAAGLL